jgi:DNA-binding response OmpR family regulator
VGARPAEPAEPLVVLLAEHEPEVAELARRYLARAGLRVRLTASPEETTAALGERSAAVAVLDLTMPGLDARRVRRLGTSAVFLLGNGMRPRDLRVSADSCLVRPFSPRLLVARVLSVLPRAARAADAGPGARAAGTEPAQPTRGGLTLTPAERRVSSAGRDIALTQTEFALLSILAGNAGRVMTRTQLLAAMERETSGRAVDTYIAQLRAKLPGPGTIRTVRGIGYVLDDRAPGDPGNIR